MTACCTRSSRATAASLLHDLRRLEHPHVPRGGEHPNKPESLRLLTAAIDAGEPLVTDAEVLQEILHRYHTSKHRDAIEPAFDAILGVVDEVFSIDLEDVQRARQLLLDQEQLSSRDALHAAVMERHKIHRIMSFDSGFDEITGLERLPGPATPDASGS